MSAIALSRILHLMTACWLLWRCGCKAMRALFGCWAAVWVHVLCKLRMYGCCVESPSRVADAPRVRVFGCQAASSLCHMAHACVPGTAGRTPCSCKPRSRQRCISTKPTAICLSAVLLTAAAATVNFNLAAAEGVMHSSNSSHAQASGCCGAASSQTPLVARV